jgi:hypothetical protein
VVNVQFQKGFWQRVLSSINILLHVWGSLGSAMLALAQHCCVSLVTQQCWTALDSLSSNNVISSIVTLATIIHTFLWYSEFYWHRVWFWDRTSQDVRVYLATDSCWFEEWFSVPVPYRSDVYVCSKSCWLCLTVVCWLLECNKVPSWIEPWVCYNIKKRRENIWTLSLHSIHLAQDLL